MKTISLVAVLVFNLASFSQSYFQAEENKLLLGGLPEVPVLNPIEISKKQEVIGLIKKEGIEYRYLNGGCEDRAHYICTLLSHHSIETGKVWCFAPAKYTLISSELLNVKDPYMGNEQLKWGYHVATYCLVNNPTGGVDTLVIDQAFNPNEFISLSSWLGNMGSFASIYMFTDKDSYSFNTINGLTVFNNAVSPPTSAKLPTFLPPIITGDFWKLNLKDDYVQNDLAINDVACFAYFDLKAKMTDQEWKFIKEKLSNIDQFSSMIKSGRPEDLSNEIWKKIIQKFDLRYKYWDSRFKEISN
jgi:hypothetical protein